MFRHKTNSVVHTRSVHARDASDMIKKLVKRWILRSISCPWPISLYGDDYSLPLKVESLKERCVRNNTVYCNINFDDQAPVYGELLGRDYGGSITEGLTKKVERFLSEHPKVAITSFVVPNLMQNVSKWKDRFDISTSTHRKWCNYYDRLAHRFNIEYALHGFTHHQKENPFFSRHVEFAFKDEESSLSAILQGIEIFQKIGWRVCGFRQPGWDMNGDLSLCRALKDIGVSYIAGSSLDAGFNHGGVQRVSNYYPTMIGGLLNIPQNIELDWPLQEIINEIDQIINVRGVISIKGHFVDRDVCNCLRDENISKLYRIAKHIDRRYSSIVEFVTFADLANKLYRFHAQ